MKKLVFLPFLAFALFVFPSVFFTASANCGYYHGNTQAYYPYQQTYNGAYGYPQYNYQQVPSGYPTYSQYPNYGNYYNPYTYSSNYYWNGMYYPSYQQPMQQSTYRYYYNYAYTPSGGYYNYYYWR